MVSCLGSLVQSCCGEGGTLQTNITGVCGECSQCLCHTRFARTHGLCAFPVYTAQAPGCSAGGRGWGYLGCMHFPGLSHSGSGSWVLHKGAVSVGPAFCVFPWSKQLRQPGAWQVHSSQATSASYYVPGPSRSNSWAAAGVPISGVSCVFLEADLRLRPSRQMSTIQNPRLGIVQACANYASLFTVW